MPKIMQNRWVLKQIDDLDKVSTLSKELNVSPTIAKLLLLRGISTLEEARDFFRPTLNHLHNPFLMKDMHKAVERIEKAISNNEKILVYGDYDVDGTSAVALVYSFFSQLTENISYYIPDRYKEGYGISFQGIDFAADNDFSLIIALDCGIKALDKIDYALEKNIDFIICDHHLPGDKIPKATAVLDPKQPDCPYPYKELCGCGVGFKLCQAYTQKHQLSEEPLFELLDLTAIAIAADIVPINGENRVLTTMGLARINQSPRPGVKALFDVSKRKDEPVTVTDLVFIAAPRINAAGRMESGTKSVNLLTAKTAEDATTIAAQINVHNTDRKDEDKSITKEALEMIENNPALHKAKSTVLFQPHWHKGVIGIVASRVMESYYRPTIILTQSNGKVAGSARSVRGYSVYDAIDKCSDLLLQFGGHMYAAGLTMLPENVEAFQKKFEEVVSATIDEKLLTPEIQIDCEITLDELYSEKENELPKLYRIIEQFAPHGPENMTPIFILKGVVDTGYAKIVGEEHLKCTLTHPQFPHIKINSIGFYMAHHLETIGSKKPFDVVFSIDKNEWNGSTSIQIKIRDIR
jgi:single-stranded-DNA-specific exonuclease